MFFEKVKIFALVLIGLVVLNLAAGIASADAAEGVGGDGSRSRPAQTEKAPSSDSLEAASPRDLEHFCSLDEVECENEKKVAVKKEEPSKTKSFKGEVSAYNAVAAQCDDSPTITADGTDLQTYRGLPVAANNSLPFGSIIEIKGHRYAVHDCLNARYGGQNVDLLFEDYNAAKKFGRQALEVKIIELGKGTTCDARRGIKNQLGRFR